MQHPFAPLRLCVLFVFVLVCVSTRATAELTRDSSVDEILNALHARGKDLNSFTCDVSMMETDLATGDNPTRIGKVWFQQKGDSDGRIRVNFESVQREGEKAIEQRIIYILDKGKLIERNFKKHAQSSHQVLKPGEKINLLKLGEGPFPLPIGQPKEDVTKLFAVTKIDPSKDDPVDTIHIKLVPLPETQFRKFKSIDVWINKENMPIRIVTDDGTYERDTRLTNVVVNPPLNDSHFDLEDIDLKEWNVAED